MTWFAESELLFCLIFESLEKEELESLLLLAIDVFDRVWKWMLQRWERRFDQDQRYSLLMSMKRVERRFHRREKGRESRDPVKMKILSLLLSVGGHLRYLPRTLGCRDWNESSRLVRKWFDIRAQYFSLFYTFRVLRAKASLITG